MHNKKKKTEKTAHSSDRQNFQPHRKSYSALIHELVKENAAIKTETNYIDWLGQFEYPLELKIKNQAFSAFWKSAGLPEKPKLIIPSPKPRGYRTTTKRQVYAVGKQYFLTFNNLTLPEKKQLVTASVLESDEHLAIYRLLAEKLNLPAYRVVSDILNYVIVRGNYTEFTVIFNVLGMSAEIVRKLKNLSEHLTKLPHPVISAFIYVDETASDYYLESKRPQEVMSFKKIFGHDKIFVSYKGRKFLYNPTSFSQINESIVPLMIDHVESIVKPDKLKRLLDLYCGYGLFAHSLSEKFGETVGMDSEGPSIKSARENSSYFKPEIPAMFVPKKITPNNLEHYLPESGFIDESFVLDPPRLGTEPGVIEWVADRKPNHVAHIFCGVDQIPKEIRRWLGSGYDVESIQPFDMFPGSPNLEVVVSLKPKVTPQRISPKKNYR